MQNAETVLGVLRERGRRGLPCDELYRQLFNPQLYLLAYGRIYANHGAMTPGVTQETVDGMSQAKIGRIIDAIRHERYRFRPARRVHIPKKNGKTRPLGLPTWSDKLVGEVVRLLLEAYYEPTFSDRSHGFRPGRGCHTALREIAHTWTGTAWFIEGDIADCFGSLDHEIMIETLSEKIHDNRFLRLVRNMLTAGYVEDWKWGATLSGAPQGGVASPVLSSIYLHKLDQFVEKGTAWNNLGNALRDVGRVEEAITAHRQVGDIFREVGDRHREGTAWNNLGIALRDVGGSRRRSPPPNRPSRSASSSATTTARPRPWGTSGRFTPISAARSGHGGRGRTPSTSSRRWVPRTTLPRRSS
jgi:hypothetical protein